VETLSYVQLMERYLALKELVRDAYCEGWVDYDEDNTFASTDSDWNASEAKRKLDELTK
jgi:hypothetical protein